jgi:hypothetical protein
MSNKQPCADGRRCVLGGIAPGTHKCPQCRRHIHALSTRDWQMLSVRYLMIDQASIRPWWRYCRECDSEPRHGKRTMGEGGHGQQYEPLYGGMYAADTRAMVYNIWYFDERNAKINETCEQLADFDFVNKQLKHQSRETCLSLIDQSW